MGYGSRDYPANCDYLRERFDLKNDCNIYDMIAVLTAHIKKEDNKKKFNDKVKNKVDVKVKEQEEVNV